MAARCSFQPVLRRSFATTSPVCGRATTSRLAHLHRTVPEYPYGPAQWYRQSNFGLYGDSRVQFGNKVSEQNEIKTRRTWHPNIRSKRLWSQSLERFIRLKVHSRVLRTIDKVGGLDEYLLGEKAARIRELGMHGWLLRWRILHTPAVKERFLMQRIEMGLPESSTQDLIGRAGEAVSPEMLKKQIKDYDKELDEEEKLEEKGREEDENLGSGLLEGQSTPERPRVNL